MSTTNIISNPTDVYEFENYLYKNPQDFQPQLCEHFLKEDLLKLLDHLEDSYLQLRQASAQMLCELLYDNIPYQHVFCETLDINMISGALCINAIPPSFIPTLAVNPEFLSSLIANIEANPPSQDEQQTLCWHISAESAASGSIQPTWIYRSTQLLSPQEFFDPLQTLFGIILKQSPQEQVTSLSLIGSDMQTTTSITQKTSQSQLPSQHTKKLSLKSSIKPSVMPSSRESLPQKERQLFSSAKPACTSQQILPKRSSMSNQDSLDIQHNSHNLSSMNFHNNSITIQIPSARTIKKGSDIEADDLKRDSISNEYNNTNTTSAVTSKPTPFDKFIAKQNKYFIPPDQRVAVALSQQQNSSHYHSKQATISHISHLTSHKTSLPTTCQSAQNRYGNTYSRLHGTAAASPSMSTIQTSPTNKLVTSTTQHMKFASSSMIPDNSSTLEILPEESIALSPQRSNAVKQPKLRNHPHHHTQFQFRCSMDSVLSSRMKHSSLPRQQSPQHVRRQSAFNSQDGLTDSVLELKSSILNNNISLTHASNNKPQLSSSKIMVSKQTNQKHDQHKIASQQIKGQTSSVQSTSLCATKQVDVYSSSILISDPARQSELSSSTQDETNPIKQINLSSQQARSSRVSQVNPSKENTLNSCKNLTNYNTIQARRNSAILGSKQQSTNVTIKSIQLNGSSQYVSQQQSSDVSALTLSQGSIRQQNIKQRQSRGDIIIEPIRKEENENKSNQRQAAVKSPAKVTTLHLILQQKNRIISEGSSIQSSSQLKAAASPKAKQQHSKQSASSSVLAESTAQPVTSPIHSRKASTANPIKIFLSGGSGSTGPGWKH